MNDGFFPIFTSRANGGNSTSPSTPA
ncbi:hypothetical protein A2U01_0101685, partial [Trifolium medium]|nr:hypothetical protein [Trifolium medium]